MTPFAQGAMNLVVPVIFLLCCYREGWAKRRTARELKAKEWLVPWVLISVLILLQLTIIPRLLGWAWLFGDEIPAWDVSPRAANAQEMLHYWALFTSYWAIAWMTSLLGIAQYRQLMWCVMAVVLFQCLYGLFAFVGGQQTILGFWPKIYYLNDVTGSFVNRNHLAGFIAICWPLTMNFVFLPHARGRTIMVCGGTRWGGRDAVDDYLCRVDRDPFPHGPDGRPLGYGGVALPGTQSCHSAQ